jgi:hypothetical protein
MHTPLFRQRLVPAFAGPLVGFALGAWIARWGRGAAGARAALPLLAFGAIVFLPACAYPVLFFSDWSYAYLIDSRSIPSALVLALLLLDAAAPAAGFVLARRVLAREALGEDTAAHTAALALAIVPLGVAVILGVALAPRLATEGTYAMVRGDFGTSPLWRSPLGYALVWLAACIAAGAYFTARAVGHDAKAAAAPGGAPAAPAPLPEEPSVARARLGARRRR